MSVIDNKFERVEENSPDRCQGITANSQCPYKKVPNSDFCPMHAGRGVQSEKNKSVRLYQLTKWRARVEELAEHEQVKSLREEIGILRMILEQLINQCTDDLNLILNSNRISDLVLKIEKVVSSCHRLEAATGLLLDKTAALQLASVIVEIIGRFVTDQDAVDQIAQEIMLSIVQQKSDLKVEKKQR